MSGDCFPLLVGGGAAVVEEDSLMRDLAAVRQAEADADAIAIQQAVAVVGVPDGLRPGFDPMQVARTNQAMIQRFAEMNGTFFRAHQRPSENRRGDRVMREFNF